MLSTLEYALMMAARGFDILPLRENGKLPYETRSCSPALRCLAGGVNIATQNPATIRRWFAANPCINYGVSGKERVIADIDVKGGKDGFKTALELGLTPDTFVVRTPTGGEHWYFAGPGTGQRPLGSGLDIRSNGGYVVGPGSIIDGKAYTIVRDQPISPVPEHIRTRLSAAPEPRTTALVPVVDPDPPGSWEAAAAYIEREPGLPDGERNNAAYRIIARLKDFGLSEATAAELLEMFWAPRCDPPFEETEATVANVYHYGRKPPGCDAISVEFEELPPDLVAPSVPAKVESPFRPLDVMRGPSAIPERPWIVPGLLMRGALTGLVAPPEAGKSTFVVALSIGLALGRLDWLGLTLKEAAPLRVVLINNEDDEDELLRRLYAICQHHGLDWSQIQDRIIIYRPTDRSGFLAIGRDPATRQLRQTRGFAELNRVMEETGADVFSLDPVAEMHEASENDNGELASKVMKPIRALAWRRNAAGLLVHHTRKPPTASSESFAGDLNSARGAGSFGAALRASFTLYSMSDQDAEHYGIRQSEKWQYSRLDTSKGSYTSKNRKPLWFRTLGYTLESGDTAPAIEPVDLTCHEDRIRDAMHDKLSGLVAAAGGMDLEEAVKTLQDDPLLAHQGKRELKKSLVRMFASPVYRNGLALQVEGDLVSGWLAE